MSQLSPSQSYAVLDKHGIYVSELCDKCGRPIGPVRFTLKDDPGVWCSRECRGDAPHATKGLCQSCGVTLAGERKGTKFCSARCRVTANRKSLTTPNSRNTPIQNTGLTDAKIGSGYIPTRRPEIGIIAEGIAS